MNNKTTPQYIDEQGRFIINNDLNKSLFVEAGAGSGKTHEMCSRIMALIGADRDEERKTIGEIVAITFTNKAANELNDRILASLKNECNKYPAELTEEKYILYKKALDDIHECYIGSINSFCSMLLRERPIEAGIDPEFSIIDDAEDKQILKETWNSFVAQATGENKKILDLMAAFGVKQDCAKSLLQTICDNQDINFKLQEEQQLLTDADSLLKMIKDTLTEIHDTPDTFKHPFPAGDTKDTDNITKNIDNLRDIAKKIPIEYMNYGAASRMIKPFANAGTVGVAITKWKDINKAKTDVEKELRKIKEEEIKSMAAGIQKKAKDVVNNINAFIYNNLLLKFAENAKEIYISKKKTAAVLNQQDLLSKTRDLLRDNPDVREYFQKKYSTLLIDEFQDTDPIQTEIAMFLACIPQHRTEKDWSKITPAEGSLFVVGDPKQSIYKFRSADIKLYNSFGNHLTSPAGQGEKVELLRNFRSTDDMCEYFNTIFPLLLPEHSIGIPSNQAVFNTIFTDYAVKENTLPTPVAFYKIDQNKTNDILDEESELLISLINNLVNNENKTDLKAEVPDENGNPIISELGGEITVLQQDKTTKQRIPAPKDISYKDILVLTLGKKELGVLSDAVARAKIPVNVTGADISARSKAFQSFADIIRAIAYPDENTYIYKVMQDRFFGLSNKTIFKFYELTKDFRYDPTDKSVLSYRFDFDFDRFLTEHKGSLKDEDKKVCESVRNCYEQLKKFAGYAKDLSPAAATEHIINDMGIMRHHLTTAPIKSGFGSFVSFIEKIRAKNLSDIWDLNSYINDLSIMLETSFEKEVSIEGEKLNAVRFMNLHKAKGLEAPIVILAAPCKGAVKMPTLHIRTKDETSGNTKDDGFVRVMKISGRPNAGFYSPVTWDIIEYEALQTEEEERMRLLYVAATRARNYLIVSDSNAKDNPWSPLFKDENGQIYPNINISRLDFTPSGVPLDNQCTIVNQSDSDSKLTLISDTLNDAFLKQKDKTYDITSPSKMKPVELEDTADNTDPEDQIITIVEIDGEIITTDISAADPVDEGINDESINIAANVYGTIVHSILETLVKNESLLNQKIKACVKESKNKLTEDHLNKVVEDFKNQQSETKPTLWERINNATEKHTEVPFFSKGADNQYINGIIDLVFKDKDSGHWVIVDYKTHGKTLTDELKQKYREQVNIYTKVWRSMIDPGEIVDEPIIHYITRRRCPLLLSEA